MQKSNTLQYAVVSSLPVMAGYLVLGMGFGVLLQDKGYGWQWSLLMSGFIYAGSMQYIAVNLLASGASLITGALMTLMVNVRHLFYGITMLDKYRDTGRKKPYLIFALTDETFSLVCSPEFPSGVDRKRYYFYLSLLNHSYWIVGSVAGSLLGAALPFDSTGIDFAMTALFVVIFAEQWEKEKQHLPAVCGVVITLLCRMAFGVSGFLIPSMAGITAAMLLARKKLEDTMHD